MIWSNEVFRLNSSSSTPTISFINGLSADSVNVAVVTGTISLIPATSVDSVKTNRSTGITSASLITTAFDTQIIERRKIIAEIYSITIINFNWLIEGIRQKKGWVKYLDAADAKCQEFLEELLKEEKELLCIESQISKCDDELKKDILHIKAQKLT